MEDGAGNHRKIIGRNGEILEKKRIKKRGLMMNQPPFGYIVGANVYSPLQTNIIVI
jgi:hypothetical protein